jgi:transcription antitermination factor NusG
MSGAPPSFAQWHALRLRSRQEFAVREALRAEGVEEFLPTFVTESQWTDRTVKVERPLFAGYSFARFVALDASRILQTRGVVEILSINQRPIPLSDEVIADLRRVVESPAPVSLCPYVAGETVRVKSGPFAGVSGVIARVKGGATLTIPVEILGRAVNVAIDAADVEAAE